MGLISMIEASFTKLSSRKVGANYDSSMVPAGNAPEDEGLKYLLESEWNNGLPEAAKEDDLPNSSANPTATNPSSKEWAYIFGLNCENARIECEKAIRSHHHPLLITSIQF